MLPLVSIVVCSRNRSGMLREALESLLALDPSDRFATEIVVIDNASTDATPEVVAEVAAKAAIPVRWILEPRRGIVPARNRGVTEARGEWIAFFDDDQFADPRWLIELMSAAAEMSVRCVGGAVHLMLPAGVTRQLDPVCRMLLGETVGMTAPRFYSQRVTPGCGNMLVHRDAFQTVGLFDERMGNRGEDTELFLRMLNAGISGWYTPKAIIHHRIPAERLTDEFLLKTAERMSSGMAGSERLGTGVWLYPFMWAARVAQAALILGPRLAKAKLLKDSEAFLGARCRFRIAIRSLREGWGLIPPWTRPQWQLAEPTHSTAS